MANNAVEKEDLKTVFIRTTRQEKTRFTVILNFISDRARLSPMTIFKQKILPKGINIPSCIIARAQRKD